MADKYLKAVKDDKVVAVGDDKSVTVTGESANTKITKGAYKVAWDNTVDKSLSAVASELVDVPEFTTLPISVTGVILDNATLALDTGKTGVLKATVAPSNATNKAVSWSSDTAAVATVDNTGKITAVKAGTAKITVKTTDGAKTAVCTVTVKDPVVNVTGVSLDNTELSVEEGATAQLKATVAPANATDKTVTWKSGNAETFTIDNNGKVTGVKAGQATAVATTKDGGKTAECKVTVTAKPEEPAE